MIPDETLAQWQALADAATEGPWYVDDVDRLYVGNRADGRTAGLWEIIYCTADVMDDLTDDAQRRKRADAAFVAASRQAIPALLAEVAELRRENATLREGIVLYAKTEDEDLVRAEAERDEAQARIDAALAVPCWSESWRGGEEYNEALADVRRALTGGES